MAAKQRWLIAGSNGNGSGAAVVPYLHHKDCCKV
jgi:hypothetical protein